MATREAHNKASVEYNKRQDNIMVRPSKEMGAKIREAAAAENMSVQGYILQTLYARTGAKGGGVVKNIESAPLTTKEVSCTISPDREKVLKDVLRDIVLNTSPAEREQLSAILSRIMKEVMKENADSTYQITTESLL